MVSAFSACQCHQDFVLRSRLGTQSCQTGQMLMKIHTRFPTTTLHCSVQCLSTFCGTASDGMLSRISNQKHLRPKITGTVRRQGDLLMPWGIAVSHLPRLDPVTLLDQDMDRQIILWNFHLMGVKRLLTPNMSQSRNKSSEQERLLRFCQIGFLKKTR